MRKEFRSYTPNAVRADKASRKLEGYPIVFGERSVLLPDWEHGAVYEVIERGALDEALLQSCDIVANINHDDNQMIGRSQGGKGSLSLTLDDHGVRMELEAPHTVYGDFAYEGSQRGDFTGMSFAFWLDPDTDVTYTREKDGDDDIYIRHINHIQGISDVSVVTHPAYPTTDVQARSSEIYKEIRAAFPAPKPKEERSDAMKKDYDTISAFLNKQI